MKLLNLTVKNSLIVAGIFAVAVAMIWLVSQKQPGQSVMQVAATASPTQTASATPSATVLAPTSSPLPKATATLRPATATSTRRSYSATPAPGLTYTPTPTPVAIAETATPIVRLSSDGPLFSEAILDAMQVKDSDGVWVKAWPQAQDLIVTVHNVAGDRYWHVSLETGQTQLLPNYKARPDTTAAVAELKQYDDRVDYVDLSPNGQWATWGSTETLLVKALGTDIPPVNLLGKVEFENFRGRGNQSAWTPQNDKLAYVIRYSGFQIRISDPLGKETLSILLDYNSPFYLAWSADSQYLAFIMLEEKQSGIHHIYVIKSNGTGLTQLTQHGIVGGPLHWSPSGDAIIYTYDVGDGSRPWIAHLAKP